MATFGDLHKEMLRCCKATTNDIDNVYCYLSDSEFFADMDPVHQDRLSNLLLGMVEMSNVRTERVLELLGKIQHQDMPE